MEGERVKILFRFYSDILEEDTVETMWAIPVDINKGFYRLDSIPFYANSIASDDIIFAEYEENEGMLTYKNTIEYSGNSTIAVVTMYDAVDINDIREEFKNLGCISEKASNCYFAMEVPAAINYHLIKERLDELENLNFIEYSEPCLSSIHNKQI
jgi:hypothetical protein